MIQDNAILNLHIFDESKKYNAYYDNLYIYFYFIFEEKLLI